MLHRTPWLSHVLTFLIFGWLQGIYSIHSRLRLGFPAPTLCQDQVQKSSWYALKLKLESIILEFTKPQQVSYIYHNRSRFSEISLFRQDHDTSFPHLSSFSCFPRLMTEVMCMLPLLYHPCSSSRYPKHASLHRLYSATCIN